MIRTMFGSLAQCVFLIVVLLFGWSACDRTSGEDPFYPSSSFTKEKREELGNRLRLAIYQAPDQFPLLPYVPPYDTSVYFFVQQLYNQITFPHRLDRQSPSANRWNINRQWPINILDTAEKKLFVIPGGGLFISKGLLLSLNASDELYYILTFQSLLVGEDLILQELLENYSVAQLFDFLSYNNSLSTPSSLDLMDKILNFQITSSSTRRIDSLTVTHICQTSLFTPLGIQALFDDNELWGNVFFNAVSYSQRLEYIQAFAYSSMPCGEKKAADLYQRYVVDIFH